MQKYERILSSIREGTRLFEMIPRGFKPEDMKKAVIEALDPYFENKDALKHFAIILIPESIILTKLRRNPLFLDSVQNCLSIYRSARIRSSQSCFDSFAWWQPQVIQSLSEFWTVLHLEVDKSTLETKEFLHECLRNIGDIIEGLTKPYLKIIFHQLKIADGSEVSPENVDSMRLGRIINELIERSTLDRLLTLPPWNIRLNHWRNIAYHHSARIQNSEIVCWYGKSPYIKEIKLSRDEFVQAVQAIFDVLCSLKLAHTLFYVDNATNIDSISSSAYRELDEAGFVNFATALASQGFEILELSKTQDEARVVVRDLSNLKPDIRRFHASQFLFPLWLLTESKILMLEYREKDNTPSLLVSTVSDICEKVYNSELEMLDLAKTMNIVDLKAKKVS